MVNIFVQTGALVRKNALVLMRSPFQLAIALLMPLLALFIAVFSSNALANNFKKSAAKSTSLVNPPVNLVEYPKCSGSLQSCPNRPRVYYAPTDVYHSKIVESLAADLGLTMGTDVFGFPTIDSLASEVADRQVAIKAERKINYAITFTTFAQVDSAFGVSKGSAPTFNNVPGDLTAAKSRISEVNGTHYSLWQISDRQFSMDEDATLPNIVYSSEPLLFKHHLDMSITKIRAEMQGVSVPSIKLAVSHFPLPAEPSRSAGGPGGQGQDAEKAADGQAKKMGASFSAAFVMFGFSPLLLVMTNLVGSEKHTGLIGVLRKLGMSEAAYWLATLITGSVLVVASSALALIATPAFPEAFQMYNWSPVITLSLFIVTGLQMVAIGLLLVALLNSPYATNLTAGFLCMICILGSALLGFTDSMSGYGSLPDIASAFQSLFDPSVKGWILMTLLPFVGFGKAFSELSIMQPDKKATLSFSHPDFFITRTFTVRTIGGKYSYTVHSTQTTFVAVLLMSLATIVVAMYLNQVGPRPFWFPFTPTYWGLGDQGDAKLNAESKQEQSLIVRNLKKTFSSSSFFIFNRKTVEAVKDVSFTVRKGRVLSLLGTNGAGKSTSVNMITGLLRPTSGYVSCFGTGSLSAIQQQIGVTAQSDVTWPLLTAGDHIRLFAAFKGVSSSPSYVQDRLSQVGLESNADQPVGQFSGGMRRRLCIVTCSIGEPPLCILDEPTSSLDPINRRKVWKFIQSLKAHAAVILVTHLLDEADALGDEICIIDGGEVKAQGSSLALKSQYGSGYECIILGKEGATLENVTDMVRQCVPAANVTQRSTEMFAVTIPKSSSVTPLVRLLRSADPKRVAFVESWEISNTTLEGVFLAVAEKAKAQRESMHQHVSKHAAGADGTESFDLPKFVPRKTLFHQVSAVFLKDWTFQLKQLKATIVAYLMTAVFLGLYFFVRSQSDESICNGGYLALRTSRSSGTTCDLGALRKQFTQMAGMCSPNSKAPCMLGDMRLPAMFSSVGPKAGARYWVQDPSSAAQALLSEDQGTWAARQQFLGKDIDIPAASVTKVDADPITTIRDNLKRMYAARKPISLQCVPSGSLREGEPEPEAYPGSSQEQDPVKEFSTLLPDFGLKINALTAQGSDVHFVLPPMPYGARYMMSLYKPTVDCRQAITPRMWTSSAQSLVLSKMQEATPELSTQTLYDTDSKLAEMFQAATVAQLRASLKTGEGIFGMFRQVPEVQAPMVMPMITSILLPMALYSLFSAYLQLPFQEKEGGLFAFYRVQGLTVAATWLGHWLFALSFTLVPLVLSAVLIVLAIPTINLGSFLILSILAIHGSISMAFLLAAILTSTTMARLLSFLFPPVAAVLSGALTFGGSAPSFMTVVFPPLPFAFNLRQLALTATPSWGLALGAFAVSTVYLVIAIALMTMADHSPLELLKARVFGSKKVDESHKRLATGDVELGDLIESEEDDEVRKERMELTRSEKGDLDRYAVKAVNVEKAFGSHRVLKGLNMAVAPGVTYGLLGHNGCGKSTLLNILMGSSRPTAGNAWVGGQLTTTRDLSSIIGVCPQQDMVIGDLTVLDNLAFFARLRGAPLFGSELDTLVRRCAELVGLKDAMSRQASALSGGMRRRLSIGIAVIGSPQVLMLDEPSGGLDAANRLGVWRLLSRIRETGNCSIILTTHYMEEADALCSRIGIMAGGRMRVLGNQVSLKNKYGNGYVLHMQLPVAVRESTDSGSQSMQALALAAENMAMDRMTATLESQLGLRGLRIQHEHQDHLAEQRARGGSFNAQDRSWAWEVKVHVPLQATCDLAGVFELMAQDVAGIKDWGIQQSSLEDIFISISNKYYQS
ncbi:hypothetical protein BCR44DRAFT_1436012 [Catenaria anguillulae PL171]|uniref:ABC transporter domain-containing protein n=1 Tax=Catenaria anguillulae PL171 TaxID=765915 RepID=A0A1Y2HJ67_9FUNG|nr:hypothetical protein BCR44DRAFT_1436012 [Catenaria anguillulae PL171]